MVKAPLGVGAAVVRGAVKARMAAMTAVVNCILMVLGGLMLLIYGSECVIVWIGRWWW
jgi:hypothetical protein